MQRPISLTADNFALFLGNAMTGSRVLQCEAGRKVLRRIFYFAHSFEPKTFKDHLTLFHQSKGIFTSLIVPAFSQ